MNDEYENPANAYLRERMRPQKERDEFVDKWLGREKYMQAVLQKYYPHMILGVLTILIAEWISEILSWFF